MSDTSKYVARYVPAHLKQYVLLLQVETGETAKSFSRPEDLHGGRVAKGSAGHPERQVGHKTGGRHIRHTQVDVAEQGIQVGAGTG